MFAVEPIDKEIMEIGIVRYTYSSGKNLMSMKFDSFGTLKIACDMRHIEGGDLFERIYDLSKENIDSIHIDGAYVSFLDDKLGQVQLKFEYDSCIVLDKFDMSGEHIDSIGSHDFNDELGDDEDFNDDSLVTQLMKIRANWTKKDFEDAYGDEWDEMPDTLEECVELMEEYIHNTYAEDYLLEVIADEE